MNTREKMVAYRNANGISTKKMADKCKMSEVLLKMVENGEVTHPNIVKRIKKAYKLTERQSEELLPVNRRLHGGNYDPDKFKDPDIFLYGRSKRNNCEDGEK